jgi:hypothetical protein
MLLLLLTILLDSFAVFRKRSCKETDVLLQGAAGRADVHHHYLALFSLSNTAIGTDSSPVVRHLPT